MRFGTRKRQALERQEGLTTLLKQAGAASRTPSRFPIAAPEKRLRLSILAAQWPFRTWISPEWVQLSGVKKKRLKRELRALAQNHEDLKRAHRQLATHAEVIALAVRTPGRVPESDLDDAIAGIHELHRNLGPSSSTAAPEAAAPV